VDQHSIDHANKFGMVHLFVRINHPFSFKEMEKIEELVSFGVKKQDTPAASVSLEKTPEHISPPAPQTTSVITIEVLNEHPPAHHCLSWEEKRVLSLRIKKGGDAAADAVVGVMKSSNAMWNEVSSWRFLVIQALGCYLR